MSEQEVRIAPNGNRLPERLPVGHRLVDTTKQQWLIGPSIGCGGFGDIYLTRQYDESRDDLKRLTQDQIIRESNSWTNVIKFEHFSGPLFAEINFYLRCARKETIEEYMTAKKLHHLGMPRFVASGIYDPAREDNPPPVCKNINIDKKASVVGPPAKRGRKMAPPANGINGINGNNNNNKKTNGVANGKQHKRIPASAQSKEKKYRFLVLQRFGDDVQKIWTRANERFDMKSAFNIALKVIDTLEYIHSHGYVHADVKASNLLIDLCETTTKSRNTSNGASIVESSSSSSPAVKRTSKAATTNGAVKRERPTSVSNGNVKKLNGTSAKLNGTHEKDCIEPEDQIYLVDFGLVERFYSKDGQHRDHVEDQRRANNGTVEFSSRDAHIGAFSRRSDLESLAYNLLYWVSGGRLPWTNCLKDHQLVEASKKWYMNNLEIFVNYCFNEDATPIDPLQLLRGIDISATTGTTTNGTSRAPSSAKSSTKSSSRCSKSSSKATSTITTTTTTTTISKRTPRSSSTTVSSSTSSSTSTSSGSSTNDSIMCAALYDFLSYISKLSFSDEPDYFLLKSILTNALGGDSAARTSRKRGLKIEKKTPPRLPKCDNPTPAMREILRKMSLSVKKR